MPFTFGSAVMILNAAVTLSFEANDERDVESHLLDGCNHSFGDDIAFHNAAENVDQNALHVGVGEDDLERGFDLVLVGAAADIEEVRGFGAKQLDDVHGRHGKARAIDQTADFTIEGDIGKIVFRRFDLALVLFANVAKIGPFFVTEGGV